MSRPTALMLVASVHLLVLYAFWRVQVPLAAQGETFTSLLFWLPRQTAPHPTPERRAPLTPERSRLADPKSDDLQWQPLLQSPPSSDTSNAITLPSDQRAHIDWSAQLAVAAKAEVDGEKRAAQQRGALTRQYDLEEDPLDPNRDGDQSFHWYDAAIHRIDTRGPLPILHLNQRCVMLLFILPACAIGHIESRGDLFQNMAATLDERSRTTRPNDVP
jgi:hypothetical protein